jgi:hypothetical protein
MKFYTYSNNNNDYTKAISLTNIRSIERINGVGGSKIRFSVKVNYCDGKEENLLWLEEEESKKVLKEIVDLLNE